MKKLSGATNAFSFVAVAGLVVFGGGCIELTAEDVASSQHEGRFSKLSDGTDPTREGDDRHVCEWKEVRHLPSDLCLESFGDGQRARVQICNGKRPQLWCWQEVEEHAHGGESPEALLSLPDGCGHMEEGVLEVRACNADHFHDQVFHREEDPSNTIGASATCPGIVPYYIVPAESSTGLKVTWGFDGWLVEDPNDVLFYTPGDPCFGKAAP